MTAQTASPLSASTWSGQMEVANNTTTAITNVAYEHCCEDTPILTVTGFVQKLANNGDGPAVTFSTASGKDDYWFISFLDVSNNLITGQLKQDFHESSADSMVEISLNPTTFTVTISGKPYTATYGQKNL